MTNGDWLNPAGVIITSVATGFGIAQFFITNRKELSFPVKNSHSIPCFIEPFDKNANELQDFIFNNKQKRVFLNVVFMGDDASYSENENMEPSIWFHVEKLEDFNHKKVEPSPDNSMSLTLNFKRTNDSCANVYSWHGQTKINGYFTIIETGGPHMGTMWALLQADKPK